MVSMIAIPILFRPKRRRQDDELDLSDLDRVLAVRPILDDEEISALREVLFYLDGCALPPLLLGCVSRLRRVIDRAPTE